MAINQTKTYPQLLEILHFNEHQRKESLRRIFDRDITNNSSFKFLSKVIRPTKVDGELNLDRVFNHLITEDEEIENKDGSKFTRRSFEKDRAMRLHWLKKHTESTFNVKLEIFSYTDRDRNKRKDVTRTYILNVTEKYIVVLEPQNSKQDYYLLSAYYLNKKWALKQMKNKLKNKLPEVY